MDRSKCCINIHLATDEHGMPLGMVVTKAGANDGVQAKDVGAAMVVKPLPAELPVAEPDERDLPQVRADGAYGNKPTREREHAFLAQFGRVGQRLDRKARRYLGWIELAACVIFLRSGFVR